MANIIHNSWEDDIERLVLFADIMGFKDRVLREQHDVLKSQLIEFKEVWSKQMQPFKIGDHLRFSQYSDSIVIVVNGTKIKSDNKGSCLSYAKLFKIHIPY